MPTIMEEQGVRPEDTQLGDFFDFQEATVPQAEVSNTSRYQCPSHPGNSCLCHGFASCDIDASTLQTSGHETEYGPEDYASFQDWIPRFVKPDEPCGYCRSRNLQCYLSYGELTCTACNTLFRSCSFAKVANQQGTTSGSVPSDMGVLDTLHTVAEDVTQEQGALTGTRALKSRAATTTEEKKANPRFSRAAVKLLKDWVDRHQDNPYPSEDEKADLGKLTGLRYGQINTWFANARRRGKVGRGRPKGTLSPSVRPSSPIGVPSSGVEIMSWENMNPLERWKHSPPTNEAAPIEQIRLALDKNELPSLDDSTPSTLGYTGFGSSREQSGSHSNSNRRAPSMTSLEQLSSHSAVSSSAAWSGSHDSFGSFSSFGSGLHGKRERRRRRKVPGTVLRKVTDDKTKRVFQCTFCTDTFKAKYDWSRHEKTLHLSLEKFICCPLGPVITDATTGGKICAYCHATDPSEDHLESHSHQTCVEKGLEARTFYRKDHLRQHLRLMHNSQLLPHMDAWKVEAKFINSRCGFCAARFTAWQDRVDHIAAHFKEGKKMVEWKGCRGLDPNVAATVLNAMPPYLIGTEQFSPNPFSASAPKRCMTVTTHMEGGGPPATCWEILTVRLGRFAKQQADAGVLLTDELLQNQARLILYDDADPWNQTAADNPEWLDLFKRAHGLDYIPHQLGGTGTNVPDDLELYGDLGVRIPFSVQLQQGVNEDDLNETEKHIEQTRECKQELHSSHNSQYPTEDMGGAPARLHQRYSSLAVPHDKAKHFESITAPYPDSGVRGQVQYTKELGSMYTNGFTPAEKAALLALGIAGPSEQPISTLDISNTANTDLLHNLGYNNPDEVLAGLGVDSGQITEAFHDSGISSSITPQDQASTGSSGGMGNGDSSPSQCCTNGDQAHLLSHLGFDSQNAQYTTESFPNPVGLDTLSFIPTFTMPPAGQGLPPINSALTNTLYTTTPLAEPDGGGGSAANPADKVLAVEQATKSVEELQMENVFMGGDGDFDFNDLSFDHPAESGGFEDMDFSIFDATQTQSFDSEFH